MTLNPVMQRSLLLAMLLAWVSPMQAQPDSSGADQDSVVPVRVLEILSGKVLLDGEALPDSNLPEDLDLAGIEMTYQFSGPVTPVLEIDGVVYVLTQESEGPRLQLLADTERRGAQVYFMGQPEAEAAAPAREALASPPAPSAPPSLPSEDDFVEAASQEAYMRQLSSRDRPLYEQIRREQSLELETLRLADRVRRSNDPIARGRLVHELRLKLEASFDLKQRIRADEIEQAEAQIAELRRLLNERAARKDQIIERRLRELVEGY